MKRTYLSLAFAAWMLLLTATPGLSQKKYDEKQLAAMKAQLAESVGKKAKDIQVMVDQIFSFSELGFQEWETSNFITSVLEKNGFTVEKGISGVPTAWMAKWGSGSP
ncbi:MAG: amidohydrolase, partial [Chitinophagia bacterium]|nr:amidohydrolase [Chitinophagia bacterium]